MEARRWNSRLQELRYGCKRFPGGQKERPASSGPIEDPNLVSDYRSQVPTTRGLLPERIKRLNIRTMSNFLLSPVFPLLSEIRFTKSLVCCTEHRARVQAWISSNRSTATMATHEPDSWKLTSCYRSARVITPSFKAVLTASPRLVAFNFLKML